MDGYDENICMNALNRIFGFTPAKACALISYMGSAKALFSEKNLCRLLPYTPGIDRICDKEYEISEREINSGLEEDVCFINYTQKFYPKLLLECPDFPIGIYVKGNTPPEELFNDNDNIAIVGTRDLTPYGKEQSRKIIDAFSKTYKAPCIVSGLALGADITAHKEALERQMHTIAVLPTGIDSIYPARHSRDASRIAGTYGCALITDYPPGTTPYPVNFIRRNRIIAGLSRATIITESKIKGGAMITANLAFSYNRDVYALPGRTSDTKSSGCNYLIKNKIAEPVISIESLLEQLGMKTDNSKLQPHGNSIPKDKCGNIGTMTRILLIIKENPGIDIESITTALGIKPSDVIRATSMLETDGLISIDMLRRCIINK